MATVDSNGILFYEETDPVSPLHTLLNTGQQSVSDAIDTTVDYIDSKITILHRDTIAERDALTGSTSTDNPLFVYVKATGLLYLGQDGTTWGALVTRSYADYPPLVSVGRITSVQAISAATFTAISWNYVDPNSDTAMRPAGTPTRLVASRAGWHEISTTVIFQNTGSGAADTRTIQFAVRDVSAASTATCRGVGGPATVATNFHEANAFLSVYLDVGDYVEINAWANIGLNVMHDQGTRATMKWVRA